MTPSNIRYREVTNTMLILNMSQRKCAGCNKQKSIGQFSDGDTLCLICRRRHE